MANNIIWKSKTNFGKVENLSELLLNNKTKQETHMEENTRMFES